MSALWKELLVIGLSLMTVAGAVYGLGDRAVLVPPPEMVVEEFIRKLSLGRWEPAREHLAESLAGQVNADSLQSFRAALERQVGAIERVQGEPSFATGAASEATARMQTDTEHGATLRIGLVREGGLWKISRLD